MEKPVAHTHPTISLPTPNTCSMHQPQSKGRFPTCFKGLLVALRLTRWTVPKIGCQCQGTKHATPQTTHQKPLPTCQQPTCQPNQSQKHSWVSALQVWFCVWCLTRPDWRGILSTEYLVVCVPDRSPARQDAPGWPDPHKHQLCKPIDAAIHCSQQRCCCWSQLQSWCCFGGVVQPGGTREGLLAMYCPRLPGPQNNT